MYVCMYIHIAFQFPTLIENYNLKEKIDMNGCNPMDLLVRVEDLLNLICTEKPIKKL